MPTDPHPGVFKANGQLLPPVTSGAVVDCAGATVSVRSQDLVTVAVVDGEIDGSNSGRWAEALGRLTALESPLVVDLAGVTFMSGSAFRTLVALNDECNHASRPWALVNGDGLRPLLRVFPDDGLPVVESVAAGVRQIEANLLRAANGDE
ncbi:STAS domain-containing protein [Mycobacterium simiae]|uniref:STAS domain-containing protein n=1 Tax=Mycobacterium simiae TaxID=1784 RepID=UPI00165FDBD4|nr:STAS domain-containing protein [Mycobacterium simiae]